MPYVLYWIIAAAVCRNCRDPITRLLNIADDAMAAQNARFSPSFTAVRLSVRLSAVLGDVLLAGHSVDREKES